MSFGYNIKLKEDKNKNNLVPSRHNEFRILKCSKESKFRVTFTRFANLRQKQIKHHYHSRQVLQNVFLVRGGEESNFLVIYPKRSSFLSELPCGRPL
jgi:hypothetical protein